ncbi:DUF5605 domain-containing protein [Phycicoccus sp. Soil803]|uniref:DUF5605 domain-containing protein n=1 Tax=Phycicoccus sp. Soil803 TaxID=1736415 RepID=UPI00070C4AA5|nr:DUF5605 domain-containing protein [Phycicoccus sp. Soil803]KRF21819.1 alpha-L-rhamnosidase [Phycicoccus sp. Soil803]
MAGFTANSLLGDVLDSIDGSDVLGRYVPHVLQEPWLWSLRSMPLGEVLQHFGGSTLDADRLARCWKELGAVEAPPPAPRDHDEPLEPRADYEADSVASASAAVSYARSAECWSVFELLLDGPTHGNPFVDVALEGVFTSGDNRIRAGGFYDGGGRYVVRFMPPSPGDWSFVTQSTARSLDGIVGHLTVTEAGADNHGPVRVADAFHFSYADGTRYLPLGTTAYAWTHQPEPLQQKTLEQLAKSPFTKLRMCLFPKSYMLNTNEPDKFVFPVGAQGRFDTRRFDVEHFRTLERRIRELQHLGIEADLILFHPYDRWGFSDLGRHTDDRYVRYVVRRLSAFRNIWWSLGNEYDLLRSKTADDWERLAGVIADEDPAAHLRSIHNWIDLYDHGQPWVTHCSVQTSAIERIDSWRTKWHKPVVIDECGYEGDIDQGWGNMTGQELTRLFWEAAVRGAYVGHGEAFLNDSEELWWSKGGSLVGDCPERVRFLASIIEASPTGVLEPLGSDWDLPWGGAEGQYLVGYFGSRQPRYRHIVRLPGVRYHVDVIDTWNMTVNRLPGSVEGSVRVDLPGRPYMAIRLVAVV